MTGDLFVLSSMSHLTHKQLEDTVKTHPPSSLTGWTDRQARQTGLLNRILVRIQSFRKEELTVLQICPLIIGSSNKLSRTSPPSVPSLLHTDCLIHRLTRFGSPGFNARDAGQSDSPKDLEAKASNLRARASNLQAMAWNLELFSEFPYVCLSRLQPQTSTKPTPSPSLTCRLPRFCSQHARRGRVRPVEVAMIDQACSS